MFLVFTNGSGWLLTSWFITQIKTGGLVVWRRKDTLVVYRGCNYQSTFKASQKIYPHVDGHQRTRPSVLIAGDFRKSNTISQVKQYLDGKMSDKNAEGELMPTGSILDDIVSFQSANISLYERETDRLLDGLGPRFIDWWMNKPLPVDADLLPEVVHEFRPPFRRSLSHARSKLTDNELTYLRKLAHSLPTHFVLGISSPTILCHFFNHKYNFQTANIFLFACIY